jgi:hypothetical protein
MAEQYDAYVYGTQGAPRAPTAEAGPRSALSAEERNALAVRQAWADGWRPGREGRWYRIEGEQ